MSAPSDPRTIADMIEELIDAKLDDCPGSLVVIEIKAELALALAPSANAKRVIRRELYRNRAAAMRCPRCRRRNVMKVVKSALRCSNCDICLSLNLIR